MTDKIGWEFWPADDTIPDDDTFDDYVDTVMAPDDPHAAALAVAALVDCDWNLTPNGNDLICLSHSDGGPVYRYRLRAVETINYYADPVEEDEP